MYITYNRKHTHPQVNISLVFCKTLFNSKKSAQMPEHLLAFKEKQVIGRFNGHYLTVSSIDNGDRLLSIVSNGTKSHHGHYSEEAIRIITIKYGLL
jgi:hypothetical protein